MGILQGMSENRCHSRGNLPVRSCLLKRLFTPLTLVNQLALIVLLATVTGVAGMAISSRLVHGVQGSAHAINKAGSLRMQRAIVCWPPPPA